MTKRGRPPKDPADRRSSDVKIPLTATEKKLIFEAASKDSTRPIVWARDILMYAALRVRGRQ